MHVHVSGHLKAAVVVVHASQFGFVAREAAVVGHRFEVSVEEAIEEAIDPVLHAALARALEQQKRREEGVCAAAPANTAPSDNRWRLGRLEPEETQLRQERRVGELCDAVQTNITCYTVHFAYTFSAISPM